MIDFLLLVESKDKYYDWNIQISLHYEISTTKVMPLLTPVSLLLHATCFITFEKDKKIVVSPPVDYAV